MAVEAHAFEQRRRRVHGTLTASCIDAAPANEGPKSGLVPVVRRGSVRLVSLLLSASERRLPGPEQPKGLSRRRVRVCA